MKTSNGQAFADSIGGEEPPMTVEESAKGVLEQVFSLLAFNLTARIFCV